MSSKIKLFHEHMNTNELLQNRSFTRRSATQLKRTEKSITCHVVAMTYTIDR